MLAGPNGSGKSTFTRQVRSGARKIDYAIPRVINPDIIAQQLSPRDPDAAAIIAGRTAIQQREVALAARESFAIETTLSGRGELELIGRAKDAGYTVTMTFISVNSVEQCIARVAERALEERRTIPTDVLMRRFPRSMRNLARLSPLLDRIDVYDNTRKTLTKVASLRRGRIVSLGERVPAWAANALRGPLELFGDRGMVAVEATRKLGAANAGLVGSPIREQDVSKRGEIAGRVLTLSSKHIAIATGVRTFAVLEITQFDRVPAIDQHIHAEFRDGVTVLRVVRRPGERGR